MPLGSTSYATKLLLTNGCHLGPAMNGSLTGAYRFHLYVQKPEPRKNRGFGGGPYPGAAWNKVDDIGKFYKPVDEQVAKESDEAPFYQVPVEGEKEFLSNKVSIIMKARIGNREVEKIYSVNEKWEDSAVKITGIVNTTYQKMTVLAENIRRFAKKTEIIIENFKPKQ